MKTHTEVQNRDKEESSNGCYISSPSQAPRLPSLSTLLNIPSLTQAPASSLVQASRTTPVPGEAKSLEMERSHGRKNSLSYSHVPVDTFMHRNVTEGNGHVQDSIPTVLPSVSALPGDATHSLSVSNLLNSSDGYNGNHIQNGSNGSHMQNGINNHVSHFPISNGYQVYPYPSMSAHPPSHNGGHINHHRNSISSVNSPIQALHPHINTHVVTTHINSPVAPLQQQIPMNMHHSHINSGPSQAIVNGVQHMPMINAPPISANGLVSYPPPTNAHVWNGVPAVAANGQPVILIPVNGHVSNGINQTPVSQPGMRPYTVTTEPPPISPTPLSITSPVNAIPPSQSTSTSQQKRKKTKDPTAPKHPMSPFLFFLTEIRPKYTAMYPGSRVGPISKMISAEWKAMSPSRKRIYEERAREDKERYAREMELYLLKKHGKGNEMFSDSERR